MLLANNGGSSEKVYVEDVFSTYLYAGTSTAQTITNGIDLAGKGGLVWMKSRIDYTTSGYSHALYDTERGNLSRLVSNGTEAASTGTGGTYMQSFNSNGFTLVGNGFLENYSPQMVSWTFRKQPKFFDVVTYTGNGSSITVNHNLGSVPGCIIIKNISAGDSWLVWHRSLSGSSPRIYLNETSAAATTLGIESSSVTSTSFTYPWSYSTGNGNGQQYVAYLFAHDAGGFGEDGSENVISCGTVTTNGSGVGSVNLGWEPQWVLAKVTNTTNDWRIIDNMRGFTATYIANGSLALRPNTTDADSDASYFCNSTGFTFNAGASQTFIYIAIRRGPMKTPTSGTSVFDVETFTGGASTRTLTSGFPPDMTMLEYRSSWNYPIVASRLTGKGKLIANQADAENTTNTSWIVTDFDSNTGTTKYNDYGGGNLSSRSVSNGFVSWMFQRAPGFMDVVCYTGTGSATTVSHNLGVAPELMIVKSRTYAGSAWGTYHTGSFVSGQPPQNCVIQIDSTGATYQSAGYWNNTAPTASVFSLSNGAYVNDTGYNYIAYLFATCPGVSKVGSYTGTGTTQQINCGFTGGARFVLIKRSDDAGDWYCWDSARGIVAANDPHLSLNTTAAEITTNDSIDPDTTGFIVNQDAATNINVSSATYIFLAIA